MIFFRSFIVVMGYRCVVVMLVIMHRVMMTVVVIVQG